MIWQAFALVLAFVLPLQPPPSPSPFGAPATSPPGQTAPGQPTPGTSSTDPGTASIKGRIMGQDSGAPLRHAVVQLFSGALHVNLGTMTDSEGRYVFTDLKGGRYNIMASKGGYVRMQYGQKNAQAPGQPVELAAAQALDRIDITLPRGGVITGTIVDDAGEPVTGAIVRPMRYGYFNGSRRIVPGGLADQTDDRGVYRLYGLAPGSYYVMATWSGALNTQPSQDRSGFAPTFYPGTADAGQASRMDVQAGQEVTGVAFQLTTTRTATVSGRVIDSSNQPLSQVTVLLQQATSSSSPLIFGASRFATTNPDGTFRIAAVPPGSYTLVAREGNMAGGPIEMGAVPITIAGADIPGVAVTLSAGATASGTVLIDGGAKASFQPRTLLVEAVSATMTPGMIGRAESRANDDWTFTLKGLFGRDRFYLGDLPDGWAVKAVRLNGQDITDSGADLTGQDRVTGLQIVLTDKLTDLTGMVTGENNQPLTDYTLVIFPVDRQRWTARSRYIRLDRPDQNGRFEIKGLPPAEYFAVAVASIEPGSQTDPDVLDRLSRDATRFTLREGESKSLTMMVAGLQ